MPETTSFPPELERRKPGRPRCSHLEYAIKRATLDLVQEAGIANLTIEGVAARAGVGKATIYRWWTTKPRLVLEAFLDLESPPPEIPDSGSLRKDLIDLMSADLELAASPKGRIISELFAASATSEDVASNFYEQWLRLRRERYAALLERAQARGEVDANRCCEAMLDTLCSYFSYCLFLSATQDCARRIEAIVDLLLEGALPRREE